jgi:hypothetical protein
MVADPFRGAAHIAGKRRVGADAGDSQQFEEIGLKLLLSAVDVGEYVLQAEGL